MKNEECPTMNAPKNMQEMLGRNIKEVIATWPAVGELLKGFGVGCVTCHLGSCQLKDVVAIHNLDPAREAELLAGVARVVFPGRTVEIPRLPRKPVARAGAAFCPPIREMVEEHGWIKRVLALIPDLTAGLAGRAPTAEERAQLLTVVDFVRNFADRYHHAKEEDLLFKYFDAGSDIIRSMLADHEAGRAHVRAAVAGVEQGEGTAVRDHLMAYAELLTEHIRKEDEILYPWMNRELTDAQVGQLFAACAAVETRFGDGPAAQRCRVELLERQMNEKMKAEESKS